MTDTTAVSVESPVGISTALNSLCVCRGRGWRRGEREREREREVNFIHCSLQMHNNNMGAHTECMNKINMERLHTLARAHNSTTCT